MVRLRNLGTHAQWLFALREPCISWIASDSSGGGAARSAARGWWAFLTPGGHPADDRLVREMDLSKTQTAFGLLAYAADAILPALATRAGGESVAVP